MTPAVLADLVRTAATTVLHEHALDPALLPADITVERPAVPAHGDYATSLALRLAGPAGVAPTELAGWLADALDDVEGIDSATVAGPGFVNLRVAAAALTDLVAQVLTAGEGYGGGEPFDVTMPPPASASIDDPAYLVRHTHAKLCALLRNGVDLGVGVPSGGGEHLRLLTHRAESELIRTIGEFPGITEARDPRRVDAYLARLAEEFLGFAETCRILPMGDEDPTDLTQARLALCAATRQVLATGLTMLNVIAPERM